MGEGPEPMVSPLGEVEGEAGPHSPENKESETFSSPDQNKSWVGLLL